MTKPTQCHVIVLSLTQAASNDLLPDQIILNGEVQPQQVIRLRNLQPKRGAVELFRLLDVIDRKTIERFALSLSLSLSLNMCCSFTYYFVGRVFLGSNISFILAARPLRPNTP